MGRMRRGSLENQLFHDSFSGHAFLQFVPVQTQTSQLLLSRQGFHRHQAVQIYSSQQR